MTKFLKTIPVGLWVLAITLLMPGFAFATGASAGAMPWDTTLMRVQEEATGPIAQGVAVISIFSIGILLITGRSGEGLMKKFMEYGLGIGLMFEGAVVVGYFFVGGVAL